MKKPEWFELIDGEHDEPYVGNKIPFGVLLLLTIVISAAFFLFPSKTAEVKPSPTIEIIQTPVDPITMPTASPDEEEDEDEQHNNNSED